MMPEAAAEEAMTKENLRERAEVTNLVLIGTAGNGEETTNGKGANG